MASTSSSVNPHNPTQSSSEIISHLSPARWHQAAIFAKLAISVDRRFLGSSQANTALDRAERLTHFGHGVSQSRMSVVGHSRPMHSVPAPINVRCYSNSDIIVRRSEVTLRPQADSCTAAKQQPYSITLSAQAGISPLVRVWTINP
jgi:hypothetical protein